MTEPQKKSPEKKAVSAETAVKKPRTKVATVVEVTPQQRYEMIQYAAYFIAKCHGFEGDPHIFWTEAEAQIDNQKS